MPYIAVLWAPPFALRRPQATGQFAVSLGAFGGKRARAKEQWPSPTAPKLSKRVGRLTNSNVWRMGRAKSPAEGLRVPPDGSRWPLAAQFAVCLGGSGGGSWLGINSLYKYQGPNVGQHAWEKVAKSSLWRLGRARWSPDGPEEAARRPRVALVSN